MFLFYQRQIISTLLEAIGLHNTIQQEGIKAQSYTIQNIKKRSDRVGEYKLNILVFCCIWQLKNTDETILLKR